MGEVDAAGGHVTWLVVQCSDRPGLLADIALAIADHGHNIKVPRPCILQMSMHVPLVQLPLSLSSRACMPSMACCWVVTVSTRVAAHASLGNEQAHYPRLTTKNF